MTNDENSSVKHAASKLHSGSGGNVDKSIALSKAKVPLSSTATHGTKRAALSTVTNTLPKPSSILTTKKKSAIPTTVRSALSETAPSAKEVGRASLSTSQSYKSSQTNGNAKKFVLLKQNNQSKPTGAARPKQTSVWIDKDVNDSSTLNFTEIPSRRSSSATTASSSTTSLSTATNAGHLKRKIYSTHSDDTELEDNEEESEYSDDESSPHKDYKRSYDVNSDSEDLPTSRRSSELAESAIEVGFDSSKESASVADPENHLRKVSRTHRFPQKNKKLKQHQRSAESLSDKSPATKEISPSSSTTIPFDDEVSEDDLDDDNYEWENARLREEAEELSKRRYRYQQSEIVDDDHENNLHSLDDEEEVMNKENRISSMKVDPVSRLEDSKTTDKDSLIISKETLQKVSESEPVRGHYSSDELNTKSTKKHSSDYTYYPASYQSTVECESSSNPDALFPIWDDESWGKMAVVCKTFHDMPGIFDEEDEDTYDISMVTEYSNEIFEYMHQLEFKYRPDASYMDRQVEIDWRKRGILVDWIVRVHAHCNLLPETLFLTINYMDRFLSLKTVEQSKLQLVGVVALYIAAKYEEITCPSAQEMAYVVENEYSVDDILRAERYMIDMLEFEMGWPGPMSFLRRSSKADDYDSDCRTLAKYLLELTIMDQRFVGAVPSWTAAASHCLAKIILNRGPWSDLHVYFGGYTEKQLQPAMDVMIEACKQPLTHHRSIYEKYTDERFKWASLHVAEWISMNYGIETRQY